MTSSDTSPAPTNPYLVLGAAIVLPASGHVILGVPVRGLQFLFFMVILAWVPPRSRRQTPASSAVMPAAS